MINKPDSDWDIIEQDAKRDPKVNWALINVYGEKLERK